MSRWLVAVLGLGAAWFVGAGCTVEAIDLEGKKCPCAEGYVCDGATGTCVAADRPDGGGTGGKEGGLGGKDGGGTGGSGATGGSDGGGSGGTGATGGTGGLGGTSGTGATGGTGGLGGTGATGGTGGTTCLSTQKLCSGTCVSKSSTTTGCSSASSCSPCPSAPTGTHAIAACTGIGPVCGIACSPSTWGNCDGSTANGCETDLSASNPVHCGKCNRTCSTANAGSATCSAGVCNTACNSGFGNCNESSKLVPDDGCETNLNTDAGDCGVCGNSCTFQGGLLSKFACFSGACGCSTATQCEASNGMSGVTCNTSTHACQCEGTACNKGEVCVKTGPNAACSCNGAAACPAGFACCAGGCGDLQTDEANCGGCGRKCATGQTCTSGVCV